MFFLFAYDTDSPQGGAHDCVGVFARLEDAMDAFDGRSDVGEIAQITPEGRLEVRWEAFPKRGYEPPLKPEWRRVALTTLTPTEAVPGGPAALPDRWSAARA